MQTHFKRTIPTMALSAVKKGHLMSIFYFIYILLYFIINKQVEVDESDVWFPNEVVKANIRGDSLIKAWREYLNLTQAELAAKAGMKQSALARLEKGDTIPRKTTLMKIAKAMNIQIEQIIE